MRLLINDREYLANVPALHILLTNQLAGGLVYERYASLAIGGNDCIRYAEKRLGQPLFSAPNLPLLLMLMKRHFDGGMQFLGLIGFQNVTVNIPQAAYRAARKGEKSLEGLFQELDTTMDLAVEAHLQKKARIQVMMSEPGRPLYQLGKEACDGRPYVELEKATYILGLIGVNDAVNFLYGMELHENDEAMNIGLRIVAHMFLKAKKLAAKHNLKFSLEESPAESAARRLAKTDLIYYGKEAGSIVKGEDEDSVYYTNSIHMTADAPISLVERIRLQSKFHSMIESGAITHAFVGEEQPSAESIAALMKEILFRTQSAQVTISPEFTFCEDCNHNFRGLVETCERCGSANVFGETRVVGYFSRIQNWNKSKRYGELVARQRGNYAVETAEQSEEIVQFA